MNINPLSKLIEKKILKQIKCNSIQVKDQTYLHAKHKSHDKNKFHVKLVLRCPELKKMSKLLSTRKIYKILDEELKSYIHSIQIELI